MGIVAAKEFVLCNVWAAPFCWWWCVQALGKAVEALARTPKPSSQLVYLTELRPIVQQLGVATVRERACARATYPLDLHQRVTHDLPPPCYIRHL